tara:strand:- start:209 stop:604 length:396 start_codon:yes stop_codon:yes gene_type:complete
MKTVLTIVAVVIFLWIIAFSFAVKNVRGWELVETPEIVNEDDMETFMAAKPIECTFDQTIIEEYIENTGEQPFARGQAYVTNGLEVYEVEVLVYLNLEEQTFSIFEVYPDGSACLSLQANKVEIFTFGLNV